MTKHGGKREGAGRKPDVTKQAVAEAYTIALAEAVSLRYGRIIRALMKKAEAGDIQAIKEIHERLLGKVPQPLANDGDKAFQIQWLQPSQLLTVHADGQNDSTPAQNAG